MNPVWRLIAILGEGGEKNRGTFELDCIVTDACGHECGNQWVALWYISRELFPNRGIRFGAFSHSCLNLASLSLHVAAEGVRAVPYPAPRRS